jgi:parvulin-like peptidyl-prolyl isomerase
MNGKIIILVFLAACGPAEAGGQVVARVGDHVIDRAAFQHRYEAAVWLENHGRARVQPARHAFLLSLIAEKVLALEGEKRDLVNDATVRPILDEIERMLVLDALYLREVKYPALPDHRDVAAFLPLFGAEADFSYMVLGSAAEAADAAGLLAAGTSFDSLQAVHGQAGQRRTMAWGELFAPLEEALFHTLEPGQVAAPVEVEGAWYLVRLNARRERVLMTPGDREEAEEAIRRLLRDRNEKRRFAEFMADFGAGRTAAVDEDLFATLAAEIGGMLDSRRTSRTDRGAERVFPLPLITSDYVALRATLAGDLARPLVRGEGVSMTLDYALTRIGFKEFVLSGPSTRVDAVLHRVLWEIIAEEMLLREGFAAQLHRQASVRRDMEMWREAYVARAMRRDLDHAIRTRLPDDPVEVRIREMLVATPEEGERLMARLAAGEDFGALARQVSLRPESAAQGGERDFEPAPMIHDAVQDLSVGKPFGPLYTDDGYLIVEVLERRAPRDTRETVDRLVLHELNRHLAGLMNQYPVAIYLDALEAVPVSSINVLQVRFLGFNNRLLAVPSLQRLTGWYDLIDRSALYPEL